MSEHSPQWPLKGCGNKNPEIRCRSMECEYCFLLTHNRLPSRIGVTKNDTDVGSAFGTYVNTKCNCHTCDNCRAHARSVNKISLTEFKLIFKMVYLISENGLTESQLKDLAKLINGLEE